MSNAVEAYLNRVRAGSSAQIGPEASSRPAASGGRLIVALDATASRQPTWDMASRLTHEMLRGVAGLDVQLAYFRGGDEFRAFGWTPSPEILVLRMGDISCRGGTTQIRKVLAHAKAEHAKQKVAALVFVGDAEAPCDYASALREQAAGLGVPTFMFQEGPDPNVELGYKGVAEASGGAYARFEPGAARKLADMLKAVAAFASGGVAALEARGDEASRVLLTQMRR